jgi:hypothetical protein
MQDGTEARIKNELNSEIQALEEHYLTIKDYLSGTEYDAIQIIGTLRAFKDGLSRISAHILTLYTLKGQKTKITWDSLFTNLDDALVTMRASANPKPRAAIQLALNLSEPKIEQVMSYLSTLKQSLK